MTLDNTFLGCQNFRTEYADMTKKVSYFSFRISNNTYAARTSNNWPKKINSKGVSITVRTSATNNAGKCCEIMANVAWSKRQWPWKVSRIRGTPHGWLVHSLWIEWFGRVSVYTRRPWRPESVIHLNLTVVPGYHLQVSCTGATMVGLGAGGHTTWTFRCYSPISWGVGRDMGGGGLKAAPTSSRPPLHPWITGFVCMWVISCLFNHLNFSPWLLHLKTWFIYHTNCALSRYFPSWSRVMYVTERWTDRWNGLQAVKGPPCPEGPNKLHESSTWSCNTNCENVGILGHGKGSPSTRHRCSCSRCRYYYGFFISQTIVIKLCEQIGDNITVD